MLIMPTEKRFDWTHTPFILITIVLLNLGIFLCYQSYDNAKYTRIVDNYIEGGYLDTEWTHYPTYIEARQQSEPEHIEALESALATARSHVEANDTTALTRQLLRDQAFHDYLHQHFGRYAQPRSTKLEFNAYQQMLKDRAYHKQWLEVRDAARADLLSTSNLSYGLIPNHASVITLVSHQFLHGDVMHLISNMFFLLMCGFAVEAAIGHWRFLGFYLLSGVGGGLLHMLLNLDSNVPLIGASGAISGVTAMYLAVFRLRKIEFFYWFFVVVGYFRAPALFILPFYIGAEIYNNYANPYATTAFMAHVGGFIIGAVAILITQRFVPMVIDKAYIEQDTSNPAQQTSLAKIYAAIEIYQFNRANHLLDEHCQQFGQSLATDLLRFNVNLKVDAKQAAKAGLSVLKTPTIEPRHLNRVATIMHAYPALLNYLSIADLTKLASQFLLTKYVAAQIKPAETLFAQAHQKQHQLHKDKKEVNDDTQRLSALAGKLAHHFQQKNNRKKYTFYNDCMIQYRED